MPGVHAPEHYTSCYGPTSSSTTSSSWTGAYRVSSGLCLPSYTMTQNNDISSPYDLSNHSPQGTNASNSPPMHSPSYQPNTDCKYRGDEETASVKLEPISVRQQQASSAQQQGHFETYNVSPPPRYESNHHGSQYSLSNQHTSFLPSTATGSQHYQYMSGVSRQMFNPIPAAVPSDQTWNRYT